MEMGAFVADCYSGESAPCRLACPLNLDVPEFIARIQRGNFKSAYNLLRDFLVFPLIACNICGQPCMDVCARKYVDSAVDLNKLERAAAAHAKSTAPVKYNIPKKKKTVAVAGAGLCGLSCAVRLLSHGYDVVIFEKTDRVGGRLHELMPGGSFVEEIELQTGHLSFELRTGTPVNDLSELRGFDAILIASGPGGDDFGLMGGLNRASLGSAENGVFLGGGLIGSSPVESIENGIRAAQSIESYLKIGRMHEMTGISGKSASRLKINPILFRPLERPAADTYTAEQALQEAAACPPCDCADCIRSCVFMQTQGKAPKNIVNDVRVHLNPVEGLQGSKGNKMINSCNACGLCAQVCSKNIDMGSFLLETRSIMHREGSLPPVFHDFWIRDMFHAQGNKSYLASSAPGYDKSVFLFFPGCQLGAADPACVERAYAYLRERQPATGILLSCCGAPAEWAGDATAMKDTADGIRKTWAEMGRPELVFACPTCEKMLRKHLPEIKLISLYEVIARFGLPKNTQTINTTVSVFDPCSSRYDPGMQSSVRELARMTGRAIEELPASGREAVCCGYGGHIYPANKELAEKIAITRAGLSPHPFVTYCINCRDILSKNGKACDHILNLVFGVADGSGRPSSLSEKRLNRELLKNDLLQQVWGQDFDNMEENEYEYEIVLAPELSEKLDRLLILEDDIRETISHAEKTGSVVLDPATGRRIGHRRIGVVTYWVEYKAEKGRYTVNNAYSHRMVIEGE